MIKSNIFRALMLTLALTMASSYALKAVPFIVGPIEIEMDNYYTWYVQTGEGPSGYTFTWYWKYDYDITSWQYGASGSGFYGWSYTTTPVFYDGGQLHLRCDVTKAGNTTTAYYDVDVINPYSSAVISEAADASDLIDVKIAPNPASEFVNVSINNLDIANNSMAEIRIINTAGQVVVNNKTSESTTKLDISNLPNGLYNLQVIVDGQKTLTKNIIKK